MAQFQTDDYIRAYIRGNRVQNEPCCMVMVACMSIAIVTRTTTSLAISSASWVPNCGCDMEFQGFRVDVNPFISPIIFKGAVLLKEVALSYARTSSPSIPQTFLIYIQQLLATSI